MSLSLALDSDGGEGAAAAAVGNVQLPLSLADFGVAWMVVYRGRSSGGNAGAVRCRGRLQHRRCPVELRRCSMAMRDSSSLRYSLPTQFTIFDCLWILEACLLCISLSSNLMFQFCICI